MTSPRRLARALCVCGATVLTTLALFTAGCSDGGSPAPTTSSAARGSATTLDGDDPSPNDVRTAVGERFTLSVAANPSVGDGWQVADTFDQSVVELVGEDFVSDDPTGELVGAGGTVTLTFEAVGAGRTLVTLENHFRGAEVTDRAAYEVVVD